MQVWIEPSTVLRAALETLGELDLVDPLRRYRLTEFRLIGWDLPICAVRSLMSAWSVGRGERDYFVCFAHALDEGCKDGLEIAFDRIA